MARRNVGCKTVEEAMRKFNIPERRQVFKYECMECGYMYYGDFHSKYSSPEACPRCGCDHDIFLNMIGPVTE